jgi:DNA-binding XRE family transcriptional regulator
MNIFERPLEEIEIILGLKVLEENVQDEKISLNYLESNKSPSLLWVGNCLLYHRIREVLSLKHFAIPEEEKWPTAELASGKLSAIVQLRPDPLEVEPYLSNTELRNWQNRMNQDVMIMDDITADLLDVISSVWLKQASHPEAMAIVTADDFLRFRGLKPQKNGEGRRGGYKKEWRKEIAKHMEILANTWISVTSMDVNERVADKKGWQCKKAKWHGESKALVITGRFGYATRDGIDPYAWRVRPGDVFSKFLFKHGWQTALISQKVLEYPIDQQWEKRLARYLAWQWRNRQSGGAYLVPFNIKTLLNAINKEVTRYNPLRTKERLEKAFDTLQRDKVITGWQYEHANEDIVGKKGWWKEWLIWKVIVEPPQEIIDQYKKIMKPVVKKREVLPMRNQPQAPAFGELIKKTRLKRGLSQMQAAEEIGVTQSTLSRVEIGKTMDYNTRKLLKKWLDENNK